MKPILIAAALLAFGAAQAHASNCPKDMADIDKAFQTVSLDAGKKAQVQKLRADGEAKHKAGDHAGSMRDLGEAKQLLGIK